MADPVVEQTAEQQAAESNAAFERGFNQERGLPVEKPEAKPQQETKPEPEVKAAPTEPQKTEEDPWKDVHPTVKAQFDSVNSRLQSLDRIEQQQRNLQGVLGGINTQLKTALAAAKAVKESGGEAPTQAQVKAAAVSPEKLAAMKEDFPEVAELIDQMEKRVAAVEAAKAPAVDVEALREEIRKEYDERLTKAELRAEESRQLASIDAKHPNWEAVIKTPEFDAWWAKQPQDIKALSASRQASDVIRVLDAYSEQQKKAQADAEAKAKAEARLKGAITPRGVPAQPTTLNDEDGFERGFKKARGG